jgi:hypothetical protein
VKSPVPDSAISGTTRGRLPWCQRLSRTAASEVGGSFRLAVSSTRMSARSGGLLRHDLERFGADRGVGRVVTAVAIPRLSPVIVTADPSVPLVGEKDVISGVTDVVMRPTELLLKLGGAQGPWPYRQARAPRPPGGAPCKQGDLPGLSAVPLTPHPDARPAGTSHGLGSWVLGTG